MRPPTPPHGLSHQHMAFQIHHVGSLTTTQSPPPCGLHHHHAAFPTTAWPRSLSAQLNCANRYRFGAGQEDITLALDTNEFKLLEVHQRGQLLLWVVETKHRCFCIQFNFGPGLYLDEVSNEELHLYPTNVYSLIEFRCVLSIFSSNYLLHSIPSGTYRQHKKTQHRISS